MTSTVWLSDLLQSGELSLFVPDPHPGVGVDGDPVAAGPVVRLQLQQVGGVARVGLPANTADLEEIQSVHVRSSVANCHLGIISLLEFSKIFVKQWNYESSREQIWFIEFSKISVKYEVKESLRCLYYRIWTPIFVPISR